MRMMHIADLHLDSAFSGFERSRAEEKREELRSCFVNAMNIAREREVDLVLIPGDLFDTPFCTLATRKRAFEAMANVGCPVIIAPGNHDYYNKNGTYADESLPENVHVFTSCELGRFDFDEIGVSVIGYAFTSDGYEENPLAAEIPLSSENINILCAHTELNAPLSKYAPMSQSTIAQNGFAYAALGHVHIAPEPIRVGKTLIAYSGFAQGRSFDELGEGGAYIVDIDRESKEAILTRVNLSKTVFRAERVDITGISSDIDAVKRIEALISNKGYGDDVALRVYLVGAITSEYNLNLVKIASAPELAKVGLLQVKNESVANYDLDHLKNDMTVKGEVYRKLLPMLESSDSQERQRAALALKFALAALDKRELFVD